MSRFLPLLMLALLPPPDARAEQPAEINYMLHCMGCHLADGSGGPPEVPDVRGEMGCLLAVPGGRAYLVQVPGAALAQISDAELAAVVNYMLETFNEETLPADWVPLTEDEVARWRDAWLSDVAAVRRKLTASLPPGCRGDAAASDGRAAGARTARDLAIPTTPPHPGIATAGGVARTARSCSADAIIAEGKPPATGDR